VGARQRFQAEAFFSHYSMRQSRLLSDGSLVHSIAQPMRLRELVCHRDYNNIFGIFASSAGRPYLDWS